MLFTRLPEKKYLLGIDLTDRFCQLSYLNTRRLAAGIDPHTFSYVTGREEFNIPAAAFRNPQSGEWAYGKRSISEGGGGRQGTSDAPSHAGSGRAGG